MRLSTPYPLYKQLADDIEAQIAQGVFATGQKLPSVRDLARIKGLSATTVEEAYRHLEDRQRVAIRAKSGVYVSDRTAVNAFPVRPMTDGNTIEHAVSDDAGSVGAAVPDDSFFPTKRLAASVATLLRRDPGILGRYHFAPGAIALRQQISRRVTDWNANVDASRVVITNGAVEAVHLCLRAVTRPGDTVIVEHPAYYGFLQIIRNLGLTALPIGNDGANGIDLRAVEQALQTRPVAAILLSTTVSNPTGYSMATECKRRLVEIAQRHHLPIIEDATFADLHFDGQCQAAQGFDREGLVMLCASLTKTVAPGMRIGWVDAGRFSRQIAYLKRISSVGQPHVMELALAQYMESGGMAKHLRRIRAVMQARVVWTIEQICAAFGNDAVIESPSGGFLLWIKFADAIDCGALIALAREAGLSVTEGALFCPSETFRHYLRLNCAAIGDETYQSAVLTFLKRARTRSGTPS